MKRVKPEGWEVCFCEFGPADAEAALAAMTEDQRTSSESSVRNLVAEIEAGKFGISNDAFVRTAGGVWLNGKHRAEAIKRTGKAVAAELKLMG